MDVIRVIWAAWLLLFKRSAHPTGPLVFYLSVFPVCLVALSALFALFAVFASLALFALCCIAPTSPFVSFADTWFISRAWRADAPLDFRPGEFADAQTRIRTLTGATSAEYMCLSSCCYFREQCNHDPERWG